MKVPLLRALLEARVMFWKVPTSESLKSWWQSAVSTYTTAKP